MAKIYNGYSKKEPNHNKILMEVRPEILKKRFLELYIQTAHVGKTCDILGMCSRTFYHWKVQDPDFYREFQMADQLALQVLEDEAMRRAVYGIDKPVFQSGKLVGYVKEYSDFIMGLLLRGRAPHKYGTRVTNEYLGADGKPINPPLQINHVHSNMPLANSEETVMLPNPNVTDLQAEMMPNTQANGQDQNL